MIERLSLTSHKTRSTDRVHTFVLRTASLSTFYTQKHHVKQDVHFKKREKLPLESKETNDFSSIEVLCLYSRRLTRCHFSKRVPEDVFRINDYR